MAEHCNCTSCFDKLCMHKVPIFSSLDKEDLEKISQLITHESFKKGDIIFHEGDWTDSIIIIQEGSTKAYKITPDGREQILYIFTEGDFFGEQNLFRNQYITYTVEALEKVKTCHLSKSNFRHLMQTYPEIAVKIIDELGYRIARLEGTVQSIGIRNVDNRIAGLLLDFISKYGRQVKDGILIRLPLSREGIANYIGIARETLSRKLSQLENDGIIMSMNNKDLIVMDYDAIQAMAGQTE